MTRLITTAENRTDSMVKHCTAPLRTPCHYVDRVTLSTESTRPQSQPVHGAIFALPVISSSPVITALPAMLAPRPVISSSPVITASPAMLARPVISAPPCHPFLSLSSLPLPVIPASPCHPCLSLSSLPLPVIPAKAGILIRIWTAWLTHRPDPHQRLQDIQTQNKP